jgi:outer membrane protein
MRHSEQSNKEYTMKKILNVAVAVAAVVGCSSVLAQKAGSFTVELGVTNLKPKNPSGPLSAPAFPNTTSDVTDDTQPTGAVNYALTDNIVISVPLGLGFKHDIVGSGRAAGFGKIADVRALPITAIAQYRFGSPEATIRPYVGLGATYAKFYKARGTAALTALTNPGGTPTTLTIGSKFAPTLQAGVVFNFGSKYYANATYMKTMLDPKTTLSTGQFIDSELDPDVISLSIGMRF